jgi:hypothetical protein
MAGRAGMPGATGRVRPAIPPRGLAGLVVAVLCLAAAFFSAHPVPAAVPGEAPAQAPLAGQEEFSAGRGSPLPAPASPTQGLLRVELKKTAPLSGTVRAGGAVSFEAALFAGEAPVPAQGYVFRWESDAGARFSTPRVRREYGRVCPSRPPEVWVTFFVPLVGRGSRNPVAASEALEMGRAGPVFRLSVSPGEPRVETRRSGPRSRTSPYARSVDFRWAALPRNAVLVDVGEKEITFYLRDATRPRSRSRPGCPWPARTGPGLGRGHGQGRTGWR